MRISLLLASVLVVSSADVAWAQSSASDKDPRAAEVRFGDGSVVRMSLLQESIEVQTKYGKLVVPTSEVRRIDMGRHVPVGLDRSIDDSIRLLSSDAFKQREDATKTLLQAGHWAMPALQKASASPEIELAKRAQFLAQKISEKAAPEALRIRVEDVIQTTEFPIVGRIVSTSFKAHSPLFGEQALRLSDVRSIQLRGPRAQAEFALDAAKHGSASDQWLDTGVSVDPQLKLSIVAEGQVDLWPQTPGQYVAAPRGFNTPGKGGTFLAGALVGKIGESGRPFLVGERYEGVPTDEGRLFLHVVPSPWNNASSGVYRIRVQSESAALASR